MDNSKTKIRDILIKEKEILYNKDKQLFLKKPYKEMNYCLNLMSENIEKYFLISKYKNLSKKGKFMKEKI